MCSVHKHKLPIHKVRSENDKRSAHGERQHQLDNSWLGTVIGDSDAELNNDDVTDAPSRACERTLRWNGRSSHVR